MGNCRLQYRPNNYILCRQLWSSWIPGALYIDGDRCQWMHKHLQCKLCSRSACMRCRYTSAGSTDMRIQFVLFIVKLFNCYLKSGIWLVKEWYAYWRGN